MDKRKNIAQWIAVIICLLPSPIILTVMMGVADAMNMSFFVALPLLGIAGLIVLWLTCSVLYKIIYFIIK